MEFHVPVVTVPEGAPIVPAKKPYPGFWQAVLLVLLVQVLANVAGGILLVALMVNEYRKSGSLDPTLVSTLDPAFLGIFANTVGFGLVIYLAARRTGLPRGGIFPLRSVRFSLWLPMLPTMAGGLLVANEVTNLLVKYMPPPDWVKDLFSQLLGKGTGVPGFIFLVVVAPITEELLFRGVVLRGFLARYGKTKAILGSAALFGLIHGIPWQILPAFILGLFFAWWTVETGSLWPALVFHAFTNGFAFVQGLTQDSADVFQVVPQPFWLTALGVGLIAIGVYWGRRMYLNQPTRAGEVSPDLPGSVPGLTNEGDRL
jgi:membrane protease YdiL (CAAX protease family)